MTELSLIALAAALATGQAATPTAPAPMQAAPAAAGTTAANPTVGGAAMLPTQTVVQNASAAPNLTTLVAAVKAAGLVPTLSGPGPFTVFAPTNDAFGHLAPGTVDNLLKPENKPTLVKVLTYHVVPGTITSAQLKQMVTAGGGTAKLTTVEGEPLTVTLVNNIVTLTDVHGNKSYVETADVKQANGVVHVVNGVVLPTVN
ncbi:MULTISPECIES: fasciclin domain-containing protein [unclassified Sphingomonas]|uniref:fasciclin domain-containing protein n=1 Tax=unclassified Sphingomonas TaxID=196159 RepID=UPI00226A6975|nr:MULTISPECIES: fasciclin domain-containing protein [unclassified Sphingomonas]